jgi:hypothetical protein
LAKVDRFFPIVNRTRGGGKQVHPLDAFQHRRIIMDYKASGAPKGPKGTPRHQEHNAFGGKKIANKRPSKAELLAKMKENAEKAKK